MYVSCMVVVGLVSDICICHTFGVIMYVLEDIYLKSISLPSQLCICMYIMNFH